MLPEHTTGKPFGNLGLLLHALATYLKTFVMAEKPYFIEDTFQGVDHDAKVASGQGLFIVGKEPVANSVKCRRNGKRATLTTDDSRRPA